MVRCRTLKIGYRLAAIVLLGALMMRPGFAEDAGSGAHGDGKASTSGESNAARAPSGEDAGGGATKPQPHAPRGEDGKAHDGPPASNETVKDANPPVPGGTEMGAIDTSIAPSRRLDKKSKIGEGKSAIESLATRNLHRRMLSVPRPPHPVVRNAIGVPIPAAQGYRAARQRASELSRRSAQHACRNGGGAGSGRQPSHQGRRERRPSCPESKSGHHAAGRQKRRNHRHWADAPQFRSLSDRRTESGHGRHQRYDNPAEAVILRIGR